jgi:hypothetical protein
MDKIITWINNHSAELGATIRYGTLEGYLDTVHEAHTSSTAPLSLPAVGGDFLVMDEECCQASPVGKLWNCWSGYFSSFPNLKRSLRVLETTLRHAELLALLAASAAGDDVVAEWEIALGWGRHTAAILQHHDAVTGTGGSACNIECVESLFVCLFVCLFVIVGTGGSACNIECVESLLVT